MEVRNFFSSPTLPSIHIMTRGKKWVVYDRAFIGQDIQIFDDKSEAIAFAKKFLAQGYHLVVHKYTGAVEKWYKPKIERHAVAA